MFKEGLEIIEFGMIYASILLTYELDALQKVIPLNDGRILNE